jgi:hypothetical protein
LSIESRVELLTFNLNIMTRKVADCRKFPSVNNCDLYISGSEEHVIEAAVAHAVASHGHTDTPELREQLKGTLVDENIAV